jgi:hypothetical protein
MGRGGHVAHDTPGRMDPGGGAAPAGLRVSAQEALVRAGVAADHRQAAEALKSGAVFSVVGAAAGALLGAVTGHPARGAGIGAVAGGVGGAAMGATKGGASQQPATINEVDRAGLSAQGHQVEGPPRRLIQRPKEAWLGISASAHRRPARGARDGPGSRWCSPPLVRLPPQGTGLFFSTGIPPEQSQRLRAEATKLMQVIYQGLARMPERIEVLETILLDRQRKPGDT